MFLIDVISSDSIVRTVSAVSRIASVVSLKDDMQSTTTRSCVARSASSMRLAPAGVISSAISGDGGASSTRMPAEWLIRNVSSDSSSPALELGDEVRDRLVLGVEVEQDADVAELERGVHEAVALAELGGRGDREVDGERRAADAALGAEHGDDATGLAALALGLRPDRDGRAATGRRPAAAATAMRESFSCSRV